MEDPKSLPTESQEGEYNSSEYTHNDIDPSIGAHGTEEQHRVERGEPDVGVNVEGENAGGDPESVAMEAVMQLAQAASQQHHYEEEHADETQQQQHGHVENSEVHHEHLPVDNSEGVEKVGSKRKLSQSRPSAGVARANKVSRNDDAGQATIAVEQGGDGHSSSEAFQLPEAWSGSNIPIDLQKAYQQHLAQNGFPISTASNAAASNTITPASASAARPTSDDTSSPPTANSSPNKPARQLSTTKRAAQNRAAQRAFRERRDKYVKVLESKAARLEAAVRVANECKRRYIESLQTIEGLRADNHGLRVALSALSGTQAGAPPAQMKIEDYLATLPEIPPVITEEEEAILPNTAATGGSSASPSATNLPHAESHPHPHPHPHSQSQSSEQQAASQSSENTSRLQEDSNPSLDSLSAVAAAAAAAAAHTSNENQAGKTSEGTDASQPQDMQAEQQGQQQQGTQQPPQDEESVGIKDPALAATAAPAPAAADAAA
ncbi:hypothetical protein BCV70DRAFT_200957 [Testicularia cyperi]|uniref:BZIP domain-containing protein n=1 Tax=Testicularia cyperi TaxID=1882483 RepID=A0A317XM45_9BASI|nr:hypothetical protein BCV70DRAFT_200957 [Testicularia cyperi]